MYCILYSELITVCFYKGVYECGSYIADRLYDACFRFDLSCVIYLGYSLKNWETVVFRTCWGHYAFGKHIEVGFVVQLKWYHGPKIILLRFTRWC